MRAIERNFSIIFLLSCLLTSSMAFAQSERGQEAREFGLGQPQSFDQLPDSTLRSQLESLPPQASARALRWLQDFSFPAADVRSLRADSEGAIFYVELDLMAEAGTASGTPTTYADVPQSTLDDVFKLHSKPGAPNTVIVDFDGHVITGTAWNGSVDPLYAVAYSTDSDFGTFSNTERKKMVDIWHRVAEDLAPFDIDVTTEEPASLNSTTGRILITQDLDANGNVIYCNGCAGGVAYVNVWGNSNYHTRYSPALVFYDNLGGGFEHYVAEAASHELGHNLGLGHDGTSTKGYYTGHGSGTVSWAPIMGVGYYQNVTQWSKGDYADANNSQDDLNIIDGKLGYDVDDHGDTRLSASSLAVDPDGTVISSNPALDPHNELPANKGIIGTGSDVDMFAFETGAGTVSLTVRPAWDAFYRATNYRGANLDIDVELQDNSGNIIAFHDPTDETSASISATVSAGTHYLRVTGVGNTTVPYPDYGSLGQYFVDGSVPPAVIDETPPTPNPMSFAIVPTAISHSAISMTATAATDETSAVEYQFRCVAGGAGCTNSAWQSSTNHTATGLAASTEYFYQVAARDASGNETSASMNAGATTFAPPPPPADPTGLTATAASDSAIDLQWTDNANDETGYQVQRSSGGNYQTIATLSANATVFTDSGLAASTSYDYRVAAFRDSDFSGYASATGSTDDPPAFTDFVASSDTPVAGSVQGSVADTRSNNGSAQSITERESGGRKNNRYSYLEHRWSFSVSAGDSVTVYANAWSDGSADGDAFEFQYSLNNGSSFSTLFTVDSTQDSNLQSAMIPGAPSGSIMVRVVDTDQTAGAGSLDTVHVDHLFIQVGTPSNDPPDGDPSGLSATAVSASQIDLSWTDGSSNESGFIVERSTDQLAWTEIADLPGGSASHSDSAGLQASTQYFYRVSAYTAVGQSNYSTANATTLEAPPLSLSASGYKQKGVKHVSLGWSGSTHVDVYRDGNKVATVNGSNYEDNLNSKGGGTHTHKVCVAGTDTCSNTTTTVF